MESASRGPKPVLLGYLYEMLTFGCWLWLIFSEFALPQFLVFLAFNIAGLFLFDSRFAPRSQAVAYPLGMVVVFVSQAAILLWPLLIGLEDRQLAMGVLSVLVVTGTRLLLLPGRTPWRG